MKNFWAIIFLLTCSTAEAQKTRRKLTYSSAINISPLALADVDHGIMVGGEYRFSPQMSVSLDAAYIFDSYYYQEARESKGFNIRPAFRYYFGKRQHEFVQVQTFYKKVNYNMHGWLGKDCVDNVPTYSQVQEYSYEKNVVGFNLMMGDILPLSDRAFFDISVGLGIRQKRHEISVPHACNPRVTNSIMDRYSEKLTTASLPFAVKFAFILD